MKPRPSMEKRRKERDRQDRKQRKAERREERKVERTERMAAAPGEDPDLVGIVAGPQPPPIVQELYRERTSKGSSGGNSED